MPLTALQWGTSNFCTKLSWFISMISLSSPKDGRTSPSCCRGPNTALQLQSVPEGWKATKTTILGFIINGHGVKMDEGKVKSITSWPQPISINKLQRFLGFANFYHKFIKNYSNISCQLICLLRGKPESLIWTEKPVEAFHTLKSTFTQAPLLVHPNPELPFTVEVNASTTMVGTILSQQQKVPPRLHPCVFSLVSSSSSDRSKLWCGKSQAPGHQASSWGVQERLDSSSTSRKTCTPANSESPLVTPWSRLHDWSPRLWR